MGVSPDGERVYVTGASDGIDIDPHDGIPPAPDFTTVAYDAATGDTVWVRRLNGPAEGFDGAFSLGVSPEGSRIYVTGLSEGIETDFDFATVAYDGATGNRVWIRRYDGPSHELDLPSSVAVSPAGARVYVTGFSGGIGTSFDYATLAYRPL